MATTVLHFDYEPAELLPETQRQADRSRTVIEQNVGEGHKAADKTGSMRAPITTRVENPDGEAIVTEAQKGYGFMVVGREPASEGPVFHGQITAVPPNLRGRLRS